MKNRQCRCQTWLPGPRTVLSLHEDPLGDGDAQQQQRGPQRALRQRRPRRRARGPLRKRRCPRPSCRKQWETGDQVSEQGHFFFSLLRLSLIGCPTPPFVDAGPILCAPSRVSRATVVASPLDLARGITDAPATRRTCQSATEAVRQGGMNEVG